MNVSLIMTVKNEGESIRPLLDSIVHQTRLPDEIVICDGGSDDNTLEEIMAYQTWLPLRVLVAPEANISRGRNIAIAHAQSPIIAVTDAGVTLSPYWLEDIVRPIELGDTQLVAGWFDADPFTDFEVVMGATVLPSKWDIDPSTFLPSSRSVAFLRSAWEASGGYPEWLDYGEDLVFDFQLQENAGKFVWAETAVAYFRPRSSLRAFFKQYYLYARGDGKANLWPKRHLIRYITYLFVLPFLLASAIQNKKWWGWLGLGAGAVAYCKRPAERLWPATWGWGIPTRLLAFLLIPIIRVIGDVAKMLGYPIGLIWRWQHKAQLPK